MALSPGPDAAEKRASPSGPSSRYSVYSIGSILKVVLKVDLSVGERRNSVWASAAMTRFTEHDAVMPISFTLQIRDALPLPRRGRASLRRANRPRSSNDKK